MYLVAIYTAICYSLNDGHYISRVVFARLSLIYLLFYQVKGLEKGRKNAKFAEGDTSFEDRVDR
jgi:hypothetical protein